MPDSPSDQKGRGNLGLVKEPVTYLEPALWKKITEASTEQDFCQSWIRLQCRIINNASGGVVVLGDPDAGHYAPVAFWPKGLRERKHFAKIIEEALKQDKGVVLKSESDDSDLSDVENIHIAYPVRVDSEIHGVVAIEVTRQPDEQMQSAMRQLQWGAAWIESWLLRKKADPDAVVRQRLITVLELAAITLQDQKFKSAAMTFVTELATRLSCDRVSIGITKDENARVTALSHSAQFGKQMNLIRSIGNVMDESLDQHTVLLYPSTDEKTYHVLRAHKELARQHGADHILTIPFFDDQYKGYGALTLERSGDKHFSEEDVQLCDAVAALIAPILEEKRRNDRPLLFKAKDSFYDQVDKLLEPEHTLSKIIAGAMIFLFLFCVFAKGDFRVTAQTVMEGAIQRSITAPFEGYLFEAKFRAGEKVKKGQVLAGLDSRDLRLERFKWVSERQQYILEFRKAMAEGETATTKILQAQIEQAEAQLKLLEEQISRASISAPFDGLIVSGDLSQSLGSPVERGQVLFEVAPLDSYRVVLEVDEKDIKQIALHQKGELVLNALPDTKFTFEITKMTPVSTAKEGRNFFRVEASLDENTPRLRPGMQGIGKVNIDRRRQVWIWTHDIVDWLRLKLWSWMP